MPISPLSGNAINPPGTMERPLVANYSPWPMAEDISYVAGRGSVAGRKALSGFLACGRTHGWTTNRNWAHGSKLALVDLRRHIMIYYPDGHGYPALWPKGPSFNGHHLAFLLLVIHNLDIFLLILSKHTWNIQSYCFQKATSFYILYIEPCDT